MKRREADLINFTSLRIILGLLLSFIHEMELIMESDKNLEAVVSVKPRDADLLFFVDIANKYEVEMGVTLLIKGVWISGEIISGKTYYESLVKSFGPYQEGSLVESIADYFKGTAKVFYTKPEDQDDCSIPNNFMHLKNITQNNGSGSMAKMNNAFLRVKIEEIDGYILGKSTNE